MQEYVCGFAFSHDLKLVYLIRKKRPEWQAGKLNGIGGHIEPGESPLDAMKREFEEEAAVRVQTGNWVHVATVEGPASPGAVESWRVWFFKVRLWKGACPFTRTDEEVESIPVESIALDFYNREVIANLHWLIPLALYGKDNWPLVVSQKNIIINEVES